MVFRSFFIKSCFFRKTCLIIKYSDLSHFNRHSVPPYVFRSHFLQISKSFHNATYCYTHKSKQGNRTGFAYSIQNILSQTSKLRIHLHNRTASNFSLLRDHTHTLTPNPHPYLSHYLRLSSFTYCHFWSGLHGYSWQWKIYNEAK